MRHFTTFVTLAAGTAALAQPVVPPTATGTIELGVKQYTARADAFVPGTRPHFLFQATLNTPPFHRAEPPPVNDTFELVFLSRSRPVRVRVIANTPGRSLAELFDAHLKTLFAAFDRDGDGSLNKYETELIYAKSEFGQMLAGRFAFRGQSGALPSLDVADMDDNGRVTFEEFAAYYTPEIGKLTQTRASNFLGLADQYTPELFARLDTTRDGRLTEEELAGAEKILTPLDADEDETVSGQELIANSARPPQLGGGQSGGAMMGGTTGGQPGQVQQGDVQVYPAAIPDDAVQPIIDRYDLDNNDELAPAEIRLPKATFTALDTNKNGTLSAAELNAWRTGEPDVVVTLTAGDTAEECKAVAKRVNDDPGIALADQTTADRVVIRVDKQTLDLAAAALPEYSRTNQQRNPYAYLFPSDKQYLTDDDLVGPQFQFLRVAFDPADFDGNGRLTREEFDRYFSLQTDTTSLGLTLSHATTVPNLFQLLDANSDGRLGVKELRTAYARLLPLEPTDGRVITKAVLQPSVVVRLGNTRYNSASAAVYASQGNRNVYGGAEPPTAGPLWFRKMDRNGDGDVSAGEFLGSKAHFTALDTDSDGLISLQEAGTFDAKVRSKPSENDQKK